MENEAKLAAASVQGNDEGVSGPAPFASSKALEKSLASDHFHVIRWRYFISCDFVREINPTYSIIGRGSEVSRRADLP